MFKKMAIAALAIGVGFLLLSRFSLVRVLWNDGKNWVTKQVPPEVKLKEIRREVERIDHEIQKNLSVLAKMEVETNMLGEEVVALRDRQQKLRGDVAAMNHSLEGQAAKVSFKGNEYRINELSNKLDMAVVDYKNTKDRLKAKEALLSDKKRTLEAAHARISSMRNQKEELRTLVAKLETQIEVVKQKQMESHVNLDDSQVSRCRQMIHDLEVRLREQEKEAQLMVDYGYRTPQSQLTQERTPDEVRKAAQEVLADEEEHHVAKGEK